MTDTVKADLPTPDAPVDDRPVPTREERAALRSQHLRRRRLIGWILLGVLVVLVAAGGYVVWGTSVLGVKNVAVSSAADPLDPNLSAAVQEAAAVTTGTPLIRVDLGAVQQRVESVPGVASAAISRHWPGTLRISVTPRVPVAAVEANAAIYLMDATGTPYVTVAAKPAGLVDLRLATPGVGDPATMAGLTVVESIPADLIASVTSVTAGSPYDITVELNDGRSVVWGATTDSVRKAQILPAILGRDGTVFDISDPEFVTVR